MNVKLRRAIGLILIFVGIFLIGSVYFKKMKTKEKQEKLQNILQEVIKDEGSNNNKSVEVVSIDGFTPIALIEIPSIKLSQGLVEGITDQALQYYLGHFEGAALPGEKGNFAVAGHRVSNYSDAFVNLYKVQLGDKVIVSSKGKKFTYQVRDVFTVTPDKVEVLDNTNEATMTLITCTFDAKERLIVKGDLILTEDI